jgi:cytochrome c-type biogenesis protein CcmH
MQVQNVSMFLWIAFALMTAAAVFAVLWPLARKGGHGGGSEIAVYRDQLDEIGRDLAAGRIGEAEAQAAKVEVSRRLMAAADTAEAEKPLGSAAGIWRRRTAAIAGLVLLPAGAVALYLMLGSPQLPGQPLAWRQGAAAENQSIESLVARVEDHVAHNPEDGRGWEVLAPVYLRLGRFDDAVTAWRNAIRLNGSSAAREARLGEALVAVHNGAVTGEAKAAFERAAAIDPTDVMARFYLGMAADQDGRQAEAQAIWRDLLAKAPPDAPWAAAVRQALAQSAPPEAAPSLPGPSAADVAAASRMDPQAQKEMIGGMVARLADRMKQDGSDVEGWLRLLRAYAVLGERDKALAAVADARRALASDPDKLKRVDDLAKELGLQS